MRSQTVLQLTIFISFYYVVSQAQTNQIECKDTVIGFGFLPCMGDICVAERIIRSGRPVTERFCLVKSVNTHWQEICRGETDTANSVWQCCTTDNCNEMLEPRLESEEQVTTVIPIFRPTAAPVNPGIQCRDSRDANTTCSGDICVAKRLTSSGSATTKRFCLDKAQTPYWQELCSGLNDTATEVYQCCDTELCNDLLEPRLDSEEEVPTQIPLFNPLNITEPTVVVTEDPGLKCKFTSTNNPIHPSHPGVCHGSKCFMERFVSAVTGTIEQRWGCTDNTPELNASVICIGARNTKTSAYACCQEFDECNQFLTISLPVEAATDQESTVAPNASLLENTWLYIGAGIILLAGLIIFILGLSVLIFVLKTRKNRILGVFKTNISNCKVRINSSSTCSTESDLKTETETV